jgi:hypothetical protein
VRELTELDGRVVDHRFAAFHEEWRCTGHEVRPSEVTLRGEKAQLGAYTRSEPLLYAHLRTCSLLNADIRRDAKPRGCDNAASRV